MKKVELSLDVRYMRGGESLLIPAIKTLRKFTSLGLKEAKDLVDRERARACPDSTFLRFRLRMSLEQFGFLAADHFTTLSDDRDGDSYYFQNVVIVDDDADYIDVSCNLIS